MPEVPEERRTPGAGGRSAPVPAPGLVLPPGYRVRMDPDVLVLLRADGSAVAAFSALGADSAEVEGEALAAYRQSGEGTA